MEKWWESKKVFLHILSLLLNLLVKTDTTERNKRSILKKTGVVVF